MTSAAGSNPESSEPVLDLETQLDDLLNQIDKAEPGLLNTPAPTPQAQTPLPITASDTGDDEADMDFEGDFEAVETLDQIIAQTARDEMAADDAVAVDQTSDKPAITAELDHQPADQVAQADHADEVEDDDDADDAMFSPDDFITTEEASAEEHHPESRAADSVQSIDANIEKDEQAEDDHDPLGADLASQIQQLLDDARTDDSAPAAKPRAASQAPAPPPKIQAARTVTADDAAGETADVMAQADEPELEGEFISPAEDELADSEDLAGMLDAIAEAVARPEDAKHDKASKAAQPVQPVDAVDAVEAKSQMDSTPQPLDEEDTASMSLEDIDQMLADEADEAVAGDFETINDVIAPTPAATAGQAANQNNTDPQAADAATSPSDAQAVGAADDDNNDDEMDLDGSFETTQDIITQGKETSPGAGNFSADAAAVARELDDQPERQKPKAGIAKETAGSSGVAGKIGKVSSLAAFSKVPDVARSVCVTISRPMEAVAPQTRDLVGYAGLITLFWGSVTVIVKLIYALN